MCHASTRKPYALMECMSLHVSHAHHMGRGDSRLDSSQPVLQVQQFLRKRLH